MAKAILKKERYKQSPASTTVPRFEDSPDALILSGICIDKTAKIIEPYTDRAEVQLSDASAWDILCFDLSKQAISNGVLTPDAYAETLCAGFLASAEPYTPDHRQAFFSFRTLRRHDIGGDSKRGTVLPKHWNYIMGVVATSSGRAFLLTEQGRIGLAPHGTRPADLTRVLYTADAPFVLRPTDEKHAYAYAYRLVGQAYVHGVMDGEALLDSSYTEPSEIILSSKARRGILILDERFRATVITHKVLIPSKPSLLKRPISKISQGDMRRIPKVA
ncbi:hypothetical protein MMC16_004285 [Acarospora aff. strigata]|nr:hypothetical protein [Acarospora aff. strigata]